MASQVDPDLSGKPTLIRGYVEGVVLLNVRNEAWRNGDSLHLSVLVMIKQSLTFTIVQGALRGLEDAGHPTGQP